MNRKLRVWWPKQLQSPSSYILFGWFTSSSSASLDIVVALAIDEASLSDPNSNLEEILCKTNKDMPMNLQNKSLFSVVGQYVDDVSSTLSKVTNGVEKSSYFVSPNDGKHQRSSCQSKDNLNCGCHSSSASFQVAISGNIWIKLVNGSYGLW